MLSTFIPSERDRPRQRTPHDRPKRNITWAFFKKVRWNTQLQGLRGGRAQSFKGVSRTF